MNYHTMLSGGILLAIGLGVPSLLTFMFGLAGALLAILLGVFWLVLIIGGVVLLLIGAFQKPRGGGRK